MLERIKVPINSGEGATFLQKSHTYVINTKLQYPKNDWTLVKILDSRDNDAIQYKNKDVLKAELRKLLPVPRENIAQ
jgi:hypothetical protein